MPKKNKVTNVSADYGQKPTFKDKEGNLWNNKNQRVIYTDFSGRNNGKCATGIVWGTNPNQSKAHRTKVSFISALV